MWRLGTFESVFLRPTLAQKFSAANAAGFESVQFDWQSAGIDPWQAEIPADAADMVLQSSVGEDVAISAVSGTYNMAHPDVESREAGHAGLVRVIESTPALGASFVTLCTGTRSRDSMWHGNPENASDEAWADCRASIAEALVVAETSGVTLLVEPEPANVVPNARLARRMLDELASPSLKIVLDPANIVLSDRSRPPDVVLREAFDLLGPDIVYAHAKDLSADDQFCAAGTGIVPWDYYQELLTEVGYTGGVIFHTLSESDIPRALSLFRPSVS